MRNFKKEKPRLRGFRFHSTTQCGMISDDDFRALHSGYVLFHSTTQCGMISDMMHKLDLEIGKIAREEFKYRVEFLALSVNS